MRAVIFQLFQAEKEKYPYLCRIRSLTLKNTFIHGDTGKQKRCVRTDAGRGCRTGYGGKLCGRQPVAEDGRSKEEPACRSALVRRRTGFQFLILLFRDSRGPVRSRNRRHYLGRDSGDQRSRRHPENPASGGTFHGILAHGGAALRPDAR